MSFSTHSNPSTISSHNPSGNFFPTCWYSWHASVDIVSPGGTDSPMLAISARFAPFPPNYTNKQTLSKSRKTWSENSPQINELTKDFIPLWPSLLPFPNVKTLYKKDMWSEYVEEATKTWQHVLIYYNLFGDRSWICCWGKYSVRFSQWRVIGIILPLRIGETLAPDFCSRSPTYLHLQWRTGVSEQIRLLQAMAFEQSICSTSISCRPH